MDQVRELADQIMQALNQSLDMLVKMELSRGSIMVLGGFAGVAVGIFESPEKAVELCNEIVSETVPNAENAEKYEQIFKKYKAVQKALEPIYNGEY